MLGTGVWGEWMDVGAGNLGVLPSGGSHRRWGGGCVYRFLPGRYWQLSFIIRAGQKEKVGECPPVSLVYGKTGNQYLNAC